MFGRKQSTFTLENRLATDDVERLDFDMPAEIIPTGVTPAHERPATPRPAPASHLNHGQDQGVGDASLLKLGDGQSIGARASDPNAAPKRRAGRAKTRLLGIDHAGPAVVDVLATQDRQEASAPVTYHAVGWLVVMDGPGRGHSMPLRNGVSQLGRGDDQSVQLNFGDTSISRSNHASIAFDEEKRSFFIGHGGKANLVRLNDAPVLSTEPVAHGDLIRIGETTLKLVAFCGPEFTWADGVETEAEAEVESDEPSEVSLEAPQVLSLDEEPKPSPSAPVETI